MAYELLDLAGRGPLMIASEAQWKAPSYGPWFEKMNKGPKGAPKDRAQIGRVIHDLFLTDWGQRIFMFENFNGTPIFALSSLTTQRAEMGAAGSYAAFARKVCGLEIDGRDQYAQSADYARAQDGGQQKPKPAVAAIGVRWVSFLVHGAATVTSCVGGGSDYGCR